MASSENIDSFGYEWSLEAEATGTMNDAHAFGISVLGRSFANAVSDSKSSGFTHAMAWAKYGNLETSYVLGDSDPFDKFVIQVSSDKRFGTPLFKTIGGASRCPGEPNTIWRESDVKIEKIPWSASANNHFIPPDSTALFDIIITNASPYRETLNYVLLLTSSKSYTKNLGGNMFDLTFTINGDKVRPFGDAASLNKIESTDEAGHLKNSVLSLKIQRGNFEHSYSGIGVKLASACEWDMNADWLYREPISDTSFLGNFKWERKCPRVTWDKTTYNKFLNFVASGETPPFMNITLMNPDPLNLWTGDQWKPSGIRKMKDGEVPSESDQNVGWDSKKNHLVHPNVEFARIQWRKTGEGEWINAWDIDWSSWEDTTDSKGQLVDKNFKNFFDRYSNDGTESSKQDQMQNLFKLDVVDSDSQCADSRGAGCSLKWNLARQYFLNGLKDGSYEVRAKVYCSGYDSFATSDVRGSVTDENLSLSVDVKPPKVKSWSMHGRVFSIDYSEPITCPQLQVSAMTYEIKHVKYCNGTEGKGKVSDEHVYFNYDFMCMTETSYSLLVEFPEDMMTADGTYKITVNALPKGSKVVDAGGNPAKTQSFVTTLGDSCLQELSGTLIQSAQTMITSSAKLGDSSIETNNEDSSFLKNKHSIGMELNSSSIGPALFVCSGVALYIAISGIRRRTSGASLDGANANTAVFDTQSQHQSRETETLKADDDPKMYGAMLSCSDATC